MEEAKSDGKYFDVVLQELKLNILLQGEVESLAPLVYQIARSVQKV